MLTKSGGLHLKTCELESWEGILDCVKESKINAGRRDGGFEKTGQMNSTCRGEGERLNCKNKKTEKSVC